MLRKETGKQTMLSSERLGDEPRIQAILVGWGMEEVAIERMLDQHRALRTKELQERKDAVRKYPERGSPDRLIPANAHSMR